MSLSTLLLNENKPYLNARVNNLKLDGIIEPNVNNGYMYTPITITAATVPSGPFTVLKNVTVFSQSYRTTTYKISSNLEVNFFSVAPTFTGIRFVVYDNITTTDIYTGQTISVSGELNDKICLSLLDSFSVPEGQTNDFELQLQIETTALNPGEEPIVTGMTIFESTVQI
jgi:hypothetical protein